MSFEKRESILFIGINSSKHFSGGRYHAWLMAEAAAELGYSVSFLTNEIPVFYDQFDDESLFPAHGEIRLHKMNGINSHQPDVWDTIRRISEKPRLIVVVPHLKSSLDIYGLALHLASAYRAALLLLNFETPNWYNAYSPVPRPHEWWNGCKKIAAKSAMILSLAAEGTGYARTFYTETPPVTAFEHCWPAINNRISDRVAVQQKQKRVLFFVRFIYAEHKSTDTVLHIFGPAFRGYRFTFITGTDEIPPSFSETALTQGRKYEITVEFVGRVTEYQKWEILKGSRLLVFPSFFEGFGLPPVEATYADVPCVAYDLPVLRETCGNSLVYVPRGDLDGLRQACEAQLRSSENPERIAINKSRFTFEAYKERLDVLLQRAMYECVV